MLSQRANELLALGPRRLAALFVVPVVLIVLTQLMRVDRGPYYLNSDPDYAYLTNSLNVVLAQPPDLYEHPGLTTEMLGAVAIAARWLMYRISSGDSSLTDAVLARPEDYLGAVSTFFSVLIALAALIAGAQALRTLTSLPLALAVQASPLLFVQVPAALPRVTPEPVLIIAGLILVAVLLPVVGVGPAGTANRSFPFVLGSVLGFGLATKFTFLPLVAFVALVPGRVGKMLALVACAMSFIVFTLPVAIYYRYMLGWLQELVIHKGANGAGDVGILDPASVVANVGLLYGVAPALFVLAAACLIGAAALFVVDLRLHQVERASIRRLLLTSGVVFAAQILLTAKQPSGHYLMPSLAISGLATAALLIPLDRASGAGLRHGVVRIALVGALLAGFAYASAADADYARSVSAYADDAAQLEGRITLLNARFIDYYGSSRLEYALSFGNDFARKRYGSALQHLYPDVLFYSIWERRFYSFAGDVRAADVRQAIHDGQTVLMYGLALDGGYVQYRVGLTIDPVLVRSGKAIYHLVDVDETQMSLP